MGSNRETLTDDMRVLSQEYLGDPNEVAAKMSKVAAQGAAQQKNKRYKMRNPKL